MKKQRIGFTVLMWPPERKNIEFENQGTEAFEVTTATRVMAVEAERLLSPYGKTIKDAVDFYLAHLGCCSTSKTVKEAVADFLAAKIGQKRVLSVRYRKDLKNRLGKFSDQFATDLVAHITGGMIESWLRGLKISGVTHDNYHRVLSVFFSWAKKAVW